MAKNFRTIKGKTAEGIDVDPQLSTSDVDAFEALFDLKPTIGLVYKNQRHVVQIRCPYGIAPIDTDYGKTISYGSFLGPQIVYKDMDGGAMYIVSPTEFVEWLGKDWDPNEFNQEATDDLVREAHRGRAS